MRPQGRPFKELFVCSACTALGAFMLSSPLWWLGAIVVAFALPVSVIWAYFVVVGARPGRIEPLVARIDDASIEISSYPFRHSPLYKQVTRVPASRITCRFDSYVDPAFVLDGKEIVFVPWEMKDELAAFVARNGIATPKVPEVWGILADAYLDQPYEKSDEERDDKTLATLGVTVEERKALRRMIRGPMFWRTFNTWEWIAYSTFDVLWTTAKLAHLRFTRTFYWRVMEVALRPYPHHSK